MTPRELLALSAVQLAQALRARRTSCVAAMEAVLERAATLQPVLNAYIAIDDAGALESARAADRELQAGRLRGPLHGVPMAHKDMYYRAGRVSTCGSRILRDRVADTTATALERLDAAGALQFATLNMAEFAFGPTGHNWHTGHCRNAWDPSRITGGSSAGSGTTVAARANFAALGSDTGGSIRLPAHFCGTVGIKPTAGRVSRAGAMPLSFTADTVGPLTRTVEDAALVLGAIAGADPRDPTADARPVPDYGALLGRPVKGLRIGRAKRWFDDGLDPDVAGLLDASLETFRRLGATVVEVEAPDMEAIESAWSLVVGTEAASIHGEWLRTRPGDYSEQVRTRLAQGVAIPGTAYLDALRWRATALRAFSATVFDRCELLHVPTVAFAAPSIADTDIGGRPEMMQVLGRITRLTRPFSYLGLPALSVPVGFTAGGLPVAMQLVGRPFDEATLFAAGHAYQGTTDWHLRAPAL
ncbi:MAG TPA: amidase [Burkholderiales bacterium]